MKHQATVIAFILGNLVVTSVTAVENCPMGTMVEVPISSPDVVWTGASLQAYILANNITTLSSRDLSIRPVFQHDISDFRLGFQ